MCRRTGGRATWGRSCTTASTTERSMTHASRPRYAPFTRMRDTHMALSEGRKLWAVVRDSEEKGPPNASFPHFASCLVWRRCWGGTSLRSTGVRGTVPWWSRAPPASLCPPRCRPLAGSRWASDFNFNQPQPAFPQTLNLNHTVSACVVIVGLMCLPCCPFCPPADEARERAHAPAWRARLRLRTELRRARRAHHPHRPGARITSSHSQT